MKKSAWVIVIAFVMSIAAAGVASAEEPKSGNFLVSVNNGLKNSPIGQFFTKKSDAYKARKAAGK